MNYLNLINMLKIKIIIFPQKKMKKNNNYYYLLFYIKKITYLFTIHI